jgi:hypothetical protein
MTHLTQLTQLDGTAFSLLSFLDLPAAMAVIKAAATDRTLAEWMSRGAYRAAPVTYPNVVAALQFARRQDLQGHLDTRVFSHSEAARAVQHIPAVEAWLAASFLTAAE